jgi:hypothetical protein
MPQPTYYRLEPAELAQLARLVETLSRDIGHIPTHCAVGRGGMQPHCALRRHSTSDMPLRRSVERLRLLLRRIQLSGVEEATEPQDAPPGKDKQRPLA